MSHIDESLLQAYIDGVCDQAETETVEAGLRRLLELIRVELG